MKAEGLIPQLYIQGCTEKGRCAAPKIRVLFNPLLLKARSSLFWISNLQVMSVFLLSLSSSTLLQD